MPRTSLKDLVSAILNAHSFLLNVHARLFLPRTISIIKCFTYNILSEKDGEYGRFQSIKYFSFAMMIAMKGLSRKRKNNETIGFIMSYEGVDEGNNLRGIRRQRLQGMK